MRWAGPCTSGVCPAAGDAGVGRCGPVVSSMGPTVPKAGPVVPGPPSRSVDNPDGVSRESSSVSRRRRSRPARSGRTRAARGRPAAS
ncbi:hypothetical protein [Ornithinimicrobium kibberense]|uniref:hypothetical protein n=1 Tax=Ornithinimicrobium kibberense TaxID=282060 RepID=UPI00361C5AA5